MQEFLEIRINYDYAHLLFNTDEGKDLGQLFKSIKLIRLKKNDPRLIEIPLISQRVRKQYNRNFFFGWEIIRKYSNEEFKVAELLHLKIKTMFEPSGEECGTIYDENETCEICGANRKQIGYLHLKKNSIPKKDIARTIGGEVVVSSKFIKIVQKYGLKGVDFQKIIFGRDFDGYYQLIMNSPELNLTKNTIAGIDPFNLSDHDQTEIYKCPKGHTIGLNLISEPHVFKSKYIKDFNFFVTRQHTGINRGLLRPEPLYLCSSSFREIVNKEKLRGFEFEVAIID